MEEMKKMFDKARAEGLWFFTSYQQLWFSPDDLEKEQKNGHFRWGPTNWQLRSPDERIAQLEQNVRRSDRELKEFKEKLQR